MYSSTASVVTAGWSMYPFSSSRVHFLTFYVRANGRRLSDRAEGCMRACPKAE